MTTLEQFFGADSPLKAELPGFQPRAGQAWMAEAVAETPGQVVDILDYCLNGTLPG